MSKRILATIFIALILIGSIAVAAKPIPESGIKSQGKQAEQNDIESVQGQKINTSQQVQNQGEATHLQVNVLTRARNAEELRNIIKQSKESMKESRKEIRSELQEVHQNQNKVRVAVHALLAAENLTGGIGKNISQIAREFNNSVQKTMIAEEKIKTRSGIARFFFGGDKKNSDEINEEVAKNQNRIQKLNQLIENCNCDPEVKTTLQEQIQNIQQEQERLRQLAQEEGKKKGIFGWLFK
ncbi:MAG: hypothetical protein J7L08_00260 [Candidatus Aenigmarchaeota archaeon]|nr:hypothetical protein [Candidatus Aenigmarchaeota archaeon]